MMVWYLTFLALVGLARLFELVVSKKNWKHHSTNATQLKEPLFFWMVLLHSAVFVLLPLELFWRRPDFGGWISWTALCFTGLTLCLRFWTLSTIGRSWNVRVVYSEKYPIVHHGPYRFIRHPNYLVVMLEMAFIPLIFHLYWSAVLLSVMNGIVLWLRIGNEEAVLFKNPEWVTHMAHKPRFLPFPAKVRQQ